MKFIITTICIAAFTGMSFAQIPKVKVPSQVPPAQTKQLEKPFDQYGKLLGKDINYVMNIANIKDTVGKTSFVKFTQGKKVVEYLQLKTPTGELLGFEKNILTWVGPKP